MKFFVFCLLSALLFCSLPLGAQWGDMQYPHDAITIGEAVRMRKDPNVKAELITELPFAAYLRVLRISEKSEKLIKDDNYYYWAQVETADGKKGWIYGKYLSPVWRKVDAPNNACVYSLYGECYDWFYADPTVSAYADAQRSEWGDMVVGDELHLFRARSNPKKYYPVRNDKPFNKAKASEAYWTTPQACCAMIEDLQEYKTVKGDLQIVWDSGGVDELIRYRYTLRFENGGFRMVERKKLERHYYDGNVDHIEKY